MLKGSLWRQHAELLGLPIFELLFCGHSASPGGPQGLHRLAQPLRGEALSVPLPSGLAFMLSFCSCSLLPWAQQSSVTSPLPAITHPGHISGSRDISGLWPRGGRQWCLSPCQGGRHTTKIYAPVFLVPAFPRLPPRPLLPH